MVDIPKTGLGKIPGMIGGLAGIADFLASDRNLPVGQGGVPGGTANFFDRNNPNASVKVNAVDYNMMKASDFKGDLAENYKAAVRAVSAIQAGDITAYENLPTDRFGNRGNSVRDLVQAATVKSLVDKMDIANLGTNIDGLLGSISNLSTGTFAEAVDKLNDAERSVLEDMGVDLDDSLDISAAEQAALDKQTRESMAAAVAAANKAKAERQEAERQEAAAKRAADIREAQGGTRDSGPDDTGGFGGDAATGSAGRTGGSDSRGPGGASGTAAGKGGAQSGDGPL